MEASWDETAAAETEYPAGVSVKAATGERNRLTTFFRFFLALPHILLVGGPVAIALATDAGAEHFDFGYGSGGVLGAVACIAAVIAWFAIMFTERHPDGLYKLAAFYLRWRVRAVAYMTLLRDEYPPFGDEPYPAEFTLERLPADADRPRGSVAIRILLALPHIFVLAFLSLAWAFTTALAWLAILITGRYPEWLYGFGLGVFAWNVRVEAYLLLLRDEYPPFTLRT